MAACFDLSSGARNAVQSCLAVSNTDTVVVVTDERKAPIAQAIATQAQQLGARVAVLDLEAFGTRPFTSLPDLLAARLRQLAPQVTFFVATGQPGEIPFRMALVGMILHELHARHGHMIDIDEQLMAEGMLADYQVVAKVVERVTHRVRYARSVRVTNPKGTELVVDFDPSLKWQPCPGTYWEPGTWGNLPEGETFTCPGRIEGVIVADVLGDHLSEKYGILQHPVTFELHDGGVTHVRCEDLEIKREVDAYLAIDPNGRRVGEFAIGTNLWVRQLVGNLLQDEKLPGIHVAFGDPIGSETGANWSATTHLDVVPDACSVWVDGEPLLIAGRFERWVLDDLEGVPTWA